MSYIRDDRWLRNIFQCEEFMNYVSVTQLYIQQSFRDSLMRDLYTKTSPLVFGLLSEESRQMDKF